MDVLVMYIETRTKHVPNLTLQHYVLKYNWYNHQCFHRDFNVSKNKPIFCNSINILCFTLLKPILKYDPYHVDRFEKVDTIISFICKDIKEKLNIFCVGDRKNVFQFKMSATMVGDLRKSQPCWI